MARPSVHSAGDNSSGENPRVTSKFDRMHGHPRAAGQVSKPGGTTKPPSGAEHMAHDVKEDELKHERLPPSKVTEHSHGKQHTYHHDHPAMAGLHHGAKAKHPYNDGKQESYEEAHGYHGDHNER